jgi:hypothetical protein
MRRYSREQIELFLRAVDKALKQRADIVIIGGSAIALRFEAAHVSPDLDLDRRPLPELQSAIAEAKRTTGLDVPVETVGVLFAPDGYEERLVALPLEGLRQLTVWTPEPHDLAMMKIARGYEHDLAAVAEIHAGVPLSLETLIERFEGTWTTGPRRSFGLNFLAAVERLFGTQAASALEPRILPPA